MNIRKNIDYTEMYEALDELMTRQLPQMELYCGIGKVVCRRTEKGAAVMASEYLNKHYPDVKGFSPRSLRRMRDFYRTYEDHPTLLSSAMKLGWTQNVVIMEADLTMDLREWYMKAAEQFGWSKSELISGIAKSVHLEIVLEIELQMCDNSDSETDISRKNVIVYVSYFLKHLLRRHIIQQRCRGRPEGYLLSEYGSCIEIWQRRISKKPATSPRLQRPRLRSYRFRETAVKLHCGDIRISSCIHAI